MDQLSSAVIGGGGEKTWQIPSPHSPAHFVIPPLCRSMLARAALPNPALANIWRGREMKMKGVHVSHFYIEHVKRLVYCFASEDEVVLTCEENRGARVRRMIVCKVRVEKASLGMSLSVSHLKAFRIRPMGSFREIVVGDA
jgi:hypothetical protein